MSAEARTVVSQHPFSRMVAAASVPPEGRAMHIEADPKERAALARLLDLPAIARLDADLTVAGWRDGLRVEGTLDAVVTRLCVVTLEPFEETVHEMVEARFGSPEPLGRLIEGSGAEGEPRGTHAVDLDAPEPLIDGRADLGVLLSEFLTLGLDPYPHAPGVAFDHEADSAVEGEGPFAALAALKAPAGRT